MPASDWHLNSFERIMFRIALALGALIVVVRLGAVAVIWYLHHTR
jgi:hypothetical protein